MHIVARGRNRWEINGKVIIFVQIGEIDFGLDRGIGHIRIAAVDSEEQAVALLNPKSTQTSTVASDRKTVLLLLSHQCA